LGKTLYTVTIPNPTECQRRSREHSEELRKKKSGLRIEFRTNKKKKLRTVLCRLITDFGTEIGTKVAIGRNINDILVNLSCQESLNLMRTYQSISKDISSVFAKMMVVDSSIEGQSYCNYRIHHDASISRRPFGHYDCFRLHRRSDNSEEVTDSCHGWREVEIASISTTATKYRWNGR
jgi:hypothetical protein